MSDPRNYPLLWPRGWPRTPKGKYQNGPFKTTLAGALANVQDEIRRLGGKIVAISSNVTLGVNRPEDPGVAVYFTYDGEQTAIPCDRWSNPESNLQAIAKTVEAMRGIERWGAKHMVKAAFRGFAQLAGPTTRPWWEVLGVHADAPMATIEAGYRAQRSRTHPDRAGGSAEAFDQVQRAYDAAKAERGS